MFVLGMTLNYTPMGRLQFGSSEIKTKVELAFNPHYSQDHSDPEWEQELRFQL